MIDKDKLKNQLTKSDITNVVLSLGGQSPKEDYRGNLIFETVCHNLDGGSYKLYYYDNTKLFTCYTECQESFDVFDLISRNKSLHNGKWEFKDSLLYVTGLTGYSATEISTIDIDNKIDDWDFLDKYRKKTPPVITIPKYNNYVLDIYQDYHHQQWLQEGITSKAMKKFNIKFDAFTNKIIIPHYDIHNNLIGIRGRSLNQEDIEQGRKYMPVKVENTIYSHPISCNLYGLSQNLSTIKKLRKAFIVEGEKSVLKIESFYPDHNFSIAVCGDKISEVQKGLILQHVDEIIIGFDKVEAYKSGNVNQSIINLRYLAKRFSPYVKTFIIVDKKNLLELKDAPVDKGRDILEELMSRKIEVRAVGG